MGNPFEDLKHEHEAILFSLKMLSTMANLAKERARNPETGFLHPDLSL
jgi:hypothetical protein